MNFVRKVLGIVAAQLTLTFTMCLASAANAGFGNFMNRVDVAIYTLVGLIVTISMLACTKEWRFAVPWNYLLLLVATICEASSVAAMTAKFEVGAVLSAIFVLAITLVCLFASSFFVKESRRLQQAMVGSMFVASIATLFIVPFILMSTYGKNYEWAWVALACVGCFLSAIYVIYDLLVIMDLALVALDEYILAAFMLYADIVRLFIYILILLSEKK